MEPVPGSNLVDLHPSPNSPSDISCSSGPPSVISTRETSPASSTHHPLDASPPGPPASFQHLPDQFLGSPQQKALEMDPFQTVNGRQGKLTGELSRASHTSSGIIPGSASNFGLLQQTTGRPLAHNLPLHSSAILSPPLTAPRGLYCRDWRASTASLDGVIFPTSTTSSAGASPSASCGTSTTANNNTNKNDFATTSSGNILSSPVSPVGFGNNLSNRNSLLSSNGYLSIANLADSPYSAAHDLHDLNDNHPDTGTSNTANMHPAHGFLITEADMDKSMGYCFDRGDGQYTRLVAVDLLPFDLKGIPRRVASDEGLIVLPVPRMPGPNGQPADNQLEPQAVVTPPPSSPSDHASTDLIQNRIDSIVACSPQGTSSSPAAGAVVLSTRSRDNSRAPALVGRGAGASNNHSNANASANANANNNNKRDKIYCDKWIHDGTCAFTQQGCKFKHEMPNDRETQEKLGLFHGFPGWWKKLLAEQQRSPGAAAAAIEDSPVSSGGTGRVGASATSAAGAGAAGAGAGGGAMAVSPAYNNAWRTIQSGPAHPVESVEDARSVGFGSGGGGRRGGGAFGSRGGSRRGGGASFNAPNYGPIAPPSRLGRTNDSRGGRGGPAGPSTSHSGPGGPRVRASNASEANLYAALMDRAQARDGTGGGAGEEEQDDEEDEEEEQRGARL